MGVTLGYKHAVHTGHWRRRSESSDADSLPQRTRGQYGGSRRERPAGHVGGAPSNVTALEALPRAGSLG